MFAVVAGMALLALGLAGVRYAPAIVESQRRQGMAPLEDEPLEEADRVRTTRAAGAVVAVVGVALIAYAAV